MFWWALIFLDVAVVAGIFAFGGPVTAMVVPAKVLFVAFAALFLAALAIGLSHRHKHLSAPRGS